jgi:hypothetical protein
MRQCLEASELERRIAEMEATLAPVIPASVVPFRRAAGGAEKARAGIPTNRARPPMVPPRAGELGM